MHWSKKTEVELLASIFLYLDTGQFAYAKWYITKLRELRRERDAATDSKKHIDSPPPR